MRKFAMCISVIIILTACSEKQKPKELTISQPENIENMVKEDKQKIEALLGDYKKALNTSDAKLAQSLYTKDGVFMPTEAPSGLGSEGILKSY